MTTLSLNQIKSSKDISVEEIKVPEWRGSICIKQMSGKERDEYDAFLFKKVDAKGRVVSTKELRTSLLAIVMCDENGKNIFASMKEGVAVLAEKNGGVLASIYEKARKFNGITEDEEEVKND